MRQGRSLRLSVRALLAHELRATLAVSSVAIGVAAVLLTSAIGKGAEDGVRRAIEGMGTSLLAVRPAEVKRLVAREAMRGFASTLRAEDGEAIAELDSVGAAAPAAERSLRVKADGGALLTTVLGSTTAVQGVRRFRIRAGRFFDADDDRTARRVAVLGARVEEKLFPREAALGKAIRIRGVPFEVIGILEAKGVQADGADEDNQVVVPLQTAQRRVFNARWLSSVFVSVRDPRRMDEAEAGIGELLRVRHRLAAYGKPDDFAVQNKARLLSLQKRAVESLTLFTTGLASLALLVGGTGILALMLLSVKERTGEIGLRLAVGARPRDILVQFLVEAALLAFAGWGAGVAIGGLGAFVVATLTQWKVAVPAGAALASLAMTAVTGLGFGAYPARKASLVPPIQALTTE